MKHWTQQQVLDEAEPIGDGWKRAVIILVDEDDTSWYPASGKAQYRGPGGVKYLIHPTSVESEALDASVTLIPASAG
jgi:hypothetical protein